ncbi:MAG: hypothetical protein AABW75_04870 [Nanoarchaeota archaeon]
MVKINTLFKEKKISRISEFELERYANFFESSYKDNLEHSKKNIPYFPRWSIISGYYAMHDIKKTMRHLALKGEVCDRRSSFGCSRNHHTIKGVVFVKFLDITKLFIAKKYRIKIDFEVHATTIKLLRELVKYNEITLLFEKGYKEFLTLANDLEEARRDRSKVQYYTGTKFLIEEYKKRAFEFHEKVVLFYIEKIKELFEEE